MASHSNMFPVDFLVISLSTACPKLPASRDNSGALQRTPGFATGSTDGLSHTVTNQYCDKMSPSLESVLQQTR